MYWVDVTDQILIFAILAMSLNLLLGYTGQVSVAHAAFAAVGGYFAAYLGLKTGIPVGVAMLIGIAGAFLLGALVSIPALLLADEHVILLTLAVQTIVLVIISSVGALGGVFGLTNLPALHVFGKDLLRPGDWFGPLAIIVVVVFALLAWIGESPYGRVLRGIREDQLATQALGKDVFLKKVSVFSITAAIAAIAGALLAYYNAAISPSLFDFDQSILIVTMVVLGGRGNMLGSVLGAAVVIAAGPFFEKTINLSPDTSALWRLFAFGLLLVVVLLLRPEGLLPEGATPAALQRALRRIGGRRARGRPRTESPASGSGAVVESRSGPNGQVGAQKASSALALATDIASRSSTRGAAADGRPVVEVRDLHKSFAGIRAVNGLSFELVEGKVTGLIGPNGAGKTTVFNLLTGAIPPDEGSVLLHGQDITRWPIDRVARHGMVRSFQDVRVYPNLSVLNNIRIAIPDQRGEKLRDLFLTPWKVIRDQRRTLSLAREHLRFLGLSEKEHVKVGLLPFGEQKLVALARILATDAQVLLLDEPASGIDVEWVDRMIEIIGALRDQGLTICVVEHNMHVVERVADRLYFMEDGRITAEGQMSDLVADERLVEAYFGQR